MSNDGNNLKFPRRALVRKGMTTLAKGMLSLLTDIDSNGLERLPKHGPIILAGNHAAVLEAVMMAAYCPGTVEFISTGDIPLDPNYAFIVNTYGVIPVNRGNLDRKGLNLALNVLKQGGILGIFPEGGIWNPAQMQAQIGVAWLSYQAQVPIIPIGFGGVHGGLEKALQFKQPKLSINVGELIPPVSIMDDEASLKTNLETAARHILTEIKALIPEDDLRQYRLQANVVYHLEVDVFSHKSDLTLPDHLQVSHGSVYARFLYNPTMMDVLIRNLHLPLKPLKKVDYQTKLTPVVKAWDAILAYLEDNPGFFTYRFGIEDGLAMKKALIELRNLGKWAEKSGYALTLTPHRRYQNANTGALVLEQGGCFPKCM